MEYVSFQGQVPVFLINQIFVKYCPGNKRVPSGIVISLTKSAEFEQIGVLVGIGVRLGNAVGLDIEISWSTGVGVDVWISKEGCEA